MSPETTARLLASMNAARLLVVCGAGLSMAAPSRLPSAKNVAERCFDKYRVESDPDCDVALREDLEALAEHFVTLNTLQSVFIESLVPWSDFTRPSNSGHAAVADFLITRAAVAGISSNYDTLIERSAWEYGSDFQSSLDGDEAIACEARQGPLLKLHGCSYRDRRSTVWAPSQLDDRTIRERIEKSKTWMAASLRQKDLLIVGFWSDWEYLNSIIGIALEGLEPLSVTVIDPVPTVELQGKAPGLWQIAHGPRVIFEARSRIRLRCSGWSTRCIFGKFSTSGIGRGPRHLRADIRSGVQSRLAHGGEGRLRDALRVAQGCRRRSSN